MTESADLLAAIAAAPADDLPRLVFADWLDDRGEPAYAQFIRDQIRLAQVPQWDPLAVRARHQLKDSLGIGRPFFGALPELPIFLKWHPEKAFRRGFGSGVVVHQLSGLLEAGPQLFDLAPVEELWLSAATLDEWRQLAKSPWLKYVRKLHFHFSQGLHEPIRCLAESKYAHNIDEIWFDTLETPAAGLVIEALAQSPLAGQLKGLHLRLVHTESLPEVIAALAGGKFEKLERFSMVQAGLTPNSIGQFCELSLLDRITELDISHNQFLNADERIFFERMESCRLVSLTISSNTPNGQYEINQTLLEAWPVYCHNTELLLWDWSQKLKLLTMNDCHRIALFPQFNHNRIKNDEIRSMVIRNSHIQNGFYNDIFEMFYWPILTELDLTGNPIDCNTAELYMSEDFPQSLGVICLPKSTFDEQLVRKLESHFGDRLVWAADDAPTGLAR